MSVFRRTDVSSKFKEPHKRQKQSNQMNRIFHLLIALVSSITIYGQNVSIKTEKAEYKIEETIILVFEVKAKVDSVSKLAVGNYRIINGPSKSQSVSTINEETTFIYNLIYEIKANSTGTIEIISPTFYIENQELKAEILNLTISGNKLTEKEIDEIKFNEFINESIKPSGTIRYVLSDSYGYIEKFNNIEWTFERRLKKKEIRKLRKKKNIYC